MLSENDSIRLKYPLKQNLNYSTMEHAYSSTLDWQRII